MKTVYVIAIVALTVNVAVAQTRGGSNQPSGLGGGSNRGMTGSTGGGFGNGGMAGAGSQSGFGSSFGTGFSFDPRFGTTSMVSPFSTGATGGTGMRSGMMGMGGLGMGMGRMGMGGMGMNRMGGFGAQQQQQNKVRPTVRLGFDVSLPTPVQRSQVVQVNLSRLPEPQRFAGISVEMDGSKAIARGSLPASGDKELLRQLLLLEPGVYEVDVSQLQGAE